MNSHWGRGVDSSVITKSTIFTFSPAIGLTVIIQATRNVAPTTTHLFPLHMIEVSSINSYGFVTGYCAGVWGNAGDSWVLRLVVFVGLAEGVSGIIWISDSDIDFTGRVGWHGDF